MIRTIITTLFPNPVSAFPRCGPADYVLGFGFVVLPGALRDRRHGRPSTNRKARDHA